MYIHTHTHTIFWKYTMCTQSNLASGKLGARHEVSHDWSCNLLLSWGSVKYNKQKCLW